MSAPVSFCFLSDKTGTRSMWGCIWGDARDLRPWWWRIVLYTTWGRPCRQSPSLIFPFFRVLSAMSMNRTILSLWKWEARSWAISLVPSGLLSSMTIISKAIELHVNKPTVSSWAHGGYGSRWADFPFSYRPAAEQSKAADSWNWLYITWDYIANKTSKDLIEDKVKIRLKIK